MLRDLIDAHLMDEETRKTALEWLDKLVISHKAFSEILEGK